MRKIEYIPAIALAFLLGGIGIHRFYTKEKGLGVIYLLFFWTTIPVIAAYIDAIVWLWNGEDMFYAKYKPCCTEDQCCKEESKDGKKSK